VYILRLARQLQIAVLGVLYKYGSELISRLSGYKKLKIYMIEESLCNGNQFWIF
jgi:hypothetical protein